MEREFEVGDQVISRSREGTVVRVGWDKMRVMWEDGAESWEDEYKLKHKHKVFMVGDHVRRGSVNGCVTGVTPSNGGAFVDWEGGPRWTPNERMTLVQRFTRGDRVQGNMSGRLGVVTAVGSKIEVNWDNGATADCPAFNLTKISKSTTPSWNDVQPGDKVTFEYLGETFTATAHKSNIGAAWTCVLGTAVAAWKDGGLARLISIEKPQPPLPTKPGSAIEVPNYPGLLHRRKAHLLTEHTWISDGGTPYTDAQVQRMGWEVVE